MKRLAVPVVIVAAVVTLGCGLIHAKREKSTEPFYRKYLVAGDPLDDQIREQEKRVEANPDSADLRNDFANLLTERRFFEDAQRQYETALELDRSHFLAAYNLGLLWEAAGKPKRAISAYRKSISRKPGFPASHFHLGRLYEQRGWDGLAVKEYAKALRIDPRMRDPRVNPLIVDTRLLDRVSLENYPRDIASAALAGDRAWVDEARFRKVPVVDRPLSSSEIEDAPGPEPVDATVTAPPAQSAAPARIPARPGQTRPQSGLPPGSPPLLPAGAPPPPTPVPTPVP